MKIKWITYNIAKHGLMDAILVKLTTEESWSAQEDGAKIKIQPLKDTAKKKLFLILH